MFLLISVVAVSLFRGVDASFYYPNVQSSLLEHILVDNWGAYASNFSSAITPCTRYVTQNGAPSLNSGRTTAAQWIRVLFHDFITANISAGTGGIDASIGFETARGENSGSAFNDSFTFWRPFVNDAVSMADLVALGSAMSSNLCGGHNLPYRAGRVDATSADSTTGVPAPETDLEETLVFFERAGFNKVDAIGLTACGHTMGSVHHGGFPDVVDETAVMSNNTNGGSNFDTTRGVFDPNVLGEYLHWTGKKGGPLVTSSNATSRSDLRLYESDQNATIQALYDQGDKFLDTCVVLMGRAMDTVPSGVQLSEPIDAMPIKPINVTFDFDKNGNLKLSGKIRILSPAGEAPQSSATLQVSGEDIELFPEPAMGSSVFGRIGSKYGGTRYFPFETVGVHLGNATSFSVKSPASAVQIFVISSHTFIIPSLTTLSDSVVNIAVASKPSRSCANFAVEIAVPYSQPGTLAPKITKDRVSLSQTKDDIDGYVICYGVLDLKHVPTGMTIVTVAEGGTTIDTLLLNGGTAGW